MPRTRTARQVDVLADGASGYREPALRAVIDPADEQDPIAVVTGIPLGHGDLGFR